MNACYRDVCERWPINSMTVGSTVTKVYESTNRCPLYTRIYVLVWGCNWRSDSRDETSRGRRSVVVGRKEILTKSYISKGLRVAARGWRQEPVVVTLQMCGSKASSIFGTRWERRNTSDSVMVYNIKSEWIQ